MIQSDPTLPKNGLLTAGGDNTTAVGWFGVCALLILQFALFLQFAQREIVWGYPMAYDQTVFLSKAYETFDHMLSHGLLSGLAHGISLRVPQGNLLHLQASLTYFLLGPSRLSSIILNFAYFALLQYVLVSVALWLARSWAIAYLTMGLLWTTVGRFFIAGGGITDFRLDFISICLFGIAIGVVIRSGLLANLSWAPVVGATAAYLVLFRYINLTFVVGITAVCFVVLVIRRRSADLFVGDKAWRRLRGLVIAAGVFAALAAPMMVYSREVIFAYYVRGHLGPDKDIRVAEFGTGALVDSLLYYPRALVDAHAGHLFLTLVLVMLLILLTLAWRSRGRAGVEPSPSPVGFGETSLFLGVCFLVPFVILTLDSSKSNVVAGVLLMPILWLVAIAVIAFRDRIAGVGFLSAKAVPLLAAVVVLFGVAQEFNMATRRSPLTLHRDDTNQVLALYDLFARETQQNGWSNPRVAFDRMEDYLHPQVIPAILYERHQVFVNPRAVLGGSIFAVPEQAALTALENCDFAILTEDRLSLSVAPGVYPFNLTMLAIRPKMRDLAERTLIPLKRFHMSSWDTVLYIRPSLSAEGGNGGWILADGLTLVGDVAVMRARPEIELRGKAVFQSPIGTLHEIETPGVAARWSDTIAPGKRIPADIRKEGQEYRIHLSLPRDDIPDVPIPHIQLSFDRSFIPRDKGINDDVRHLVLPMPDRISLLPR